MRKPFWTLFAVAVLMRLALIWRAPLWYDENFTYLLARLPLEDLFRATAGDVHPPLWYLITWALYSVLPVLPAWAIRIPALVFSVVAFWLFGKLIIVLQIPKRVFWGALILMAIMPMQLWYAQEGRMYALLECLALAMLYAGLMRRWTLFTLCAVALVYTQNYGMIYCAVIGFVLIVLDWRQAVDVALAGVVTLLAYLPWMVVIYSQMGDITGRYWIVSSGAGAILGAIYKQFWASAMLKPGIISSYVLTFVVLICGVLVLLREKWSHWWTVLVMAFGPVAVAALVSALWQPMLLFRPLVGISPFLYIIAAAPLEVIATLEEKRKVYLYAASFILPITMFGIAGYYQNIAAMKGEGAQSPMTEALGYVRDNWRDGDVIFYTDDGPMINNMPYTDLPQYRMPACDQPILGALSDVTRAALGVTVADLDDVPHRRAWVFAPRSPLHPQCYETQIKDIAPEGQQVITVDDSVYITSGVWLINNGKVTR